MQSHYVINVAKDGRHLFATAEQSCVTERDLINVYHEIATRFPESEGFDISITHQQVSGTYVDPRGYPIE